MTRKWIIALLLLPALHLGAQSIRLTRYDAPNALYLDFDRLYNFNMYERSRIELGLVWVSPSETAAQQRKAFGQLTLLPYIAYGTADHGWKYGLGAMLRLPVKHNVRLCLWASNDLERAASRRLNSYQMLVPSMNDGIVTSRFVGVKGGSMDVMFTPRQWWEVLLGVRHTWEDYRFDASGYFYPTRDGGQQTPPRMFTELRTRVEWKTTPDGKGGVTLMLRGGRVQIENDNNNLGATANSQFSTVQQSSAKGKSQDLHYAETQNRLGEILNSQLKYYWQALAQYNADLGKTGLHLYAQTGFASQEAPYSRMFDLSGTAYSLYFFKNSLLTVRPNTFTTNLFAHVCLNYTAPLPLWELSWSAPHPFLQVNALWGHLLGQDENGQRLWDGLPLQAPNKGLLEPATGFDRLVHWGLLDIGFGVAYQICPLSAAYINKDPGDNIAITVVADFILDRYK